MLMGLRMGLVVGVVNGCDLLSQMSTKHALENADAELSEPQEKKRLGM